MEFKPPPTTFVIRSPTLPKHVINIQESSVATCLRPIGLQQRTSRRYTEHNLSQDFYATWLLRKLLHTVVIQPSWLPNPIKVIAYYIQTLFHVLRYKRTYILLVLDFTTPSMYMQSHLNITSPGSQISKNVIKRVSVLSADLMFRPIPKLLIFG